MCETHPDNGFVLVTLRSAEGMVNSWQSDAPTPALDGFETKKFHAELEIAADILIT